MTDDLVQFLRDRLDEDEATARETAWSPSTQTYKAWQAKPGGDYGEWSWT